jgi:hypothetical protein
MIVLTSNEASRGPCVSESIDPRASLAEGFLVFSMIMSLFSCKQQRERGRRLVCDSCKDKDVGPDISGGITVLFSFRID